MNKSELIKIVRQWANDNSADMPFWADTIAVRYDNKSVKVGEELPCSKDNFERDDSRDFPQFDTDEYSELPNLPGTSAYYVCDENDEDEDISSVFGEYLNGSDECAWEHCSIVIGEKYPHFSAEDPGEVLLEGCEVVKVLW